MKEQSVMRFCLSGSVALLLAACGGGDAFVDGPSGGSLGNETATNSTETAGSDTDTAGTDTEQAASDTEVAGTGSESSGGGSGAGSCTALCNEVASGPCANSAEVGGIGECIEGCSEGVAQFAAAGCGGEYFALVSCVVASFGNECPDGDADFGDLDGIFGRCPNQAAGFVSCLEGSGGIDFDDDFDDGPGDPPPGNQPGNSGNNDDLQAGCETLCEAGADNGCTEFGDVSECTSACVADFVGVSSALNECLAGAGGGN